MSTQLTLLPAFDEAVVFDSANVLIDMLNDGRKAKEVYDAESCSIYNGFYIFAAKNKEGSIVFTVLDGLGKIPDGFNACWRSWAHIKTELKL